MQQARSKIHGFSRYPIMRCLVASEKSPHLKPQLKIIKMAGLKRARMESLLGHVEREVLDPIYQLKAMCEADKDPRKVNLGIGGEIQS